MAHNSPVSALPFEILAPARWTAPAVFNSPYSGNHYAADFLRQSRLSALALRKSEDCFIDELFISCLDHGAPLLRTDVPRAYIDLNREPYELDPRMFSDPLPGYVNTKSTRVAAGLGTIPKVVAEGEDIYREKLAYAEATRRIEGIYLPYHRALAALLNQVAADSHPVLLLDCHSMPSSALTHIPHGAAVDVVLGDRFGTSCDPGITDLVETELIARGFSVLRNKPYAGGFITQNHGQPNKGRHALQIELNRAIYMQETSLEKLRDFEAVKQSLGLAISAVLSALPQLMSPVSLAAE